MIVLLLLAALSPESATADDATRPYLDLLQHRSGFARDVTGGAGGEVVVLDKHDFIQLRDALADDKPRWIRFKAILLNWEAREDDARLDPAMRITIHHSYFLRVNGRSPALRFGKVHYFNNFLTHWNWSGVDALVDMKGNE